MTRHFGDWLESYLDYAKFSEAPRRSHFWCGVSAVAGALRRKVWIDQAYFKWYPNFYICLVAPPGIVAKSTTSSIAIDILRDVPGVHFGPDVVTWPALVTAFAEASETFEWNGFQMPMSAMTLESSEFGNLVDPQDKQMIDLLVSLWDGKKGTFKKATKGSGTDEVPNPWINMIACTTPNWIAENFPEYMIGGGFTSRMIFVYADQKEKLVAYPARHVPADMDVKRQLLLEDLTQISLLAGQYELSEDAIAWGERWYAHHFNGGSAHLDQSTFGGYIARKQSHMHKLAMVLAASTSDRLLITQEHLELAEAMLTDLEGDMRFVFSKIGREKASNGAEKVIAFVQAMGEVSYSEAYRHVHLLFPSLREFEDIITGAVRAGYISFDESKAKLRAGVSLPKAGKPPARAEVKENF